MKLNKSICCLAAITAVVMTTSASADSLKSKVAFNTGIAEKAAEQPANGIRVSYQITLQGGELNGCTADVIETLYGRDKGAWGIFDITADVACANGGFAYLSSGAWDGKGFHASGAINEGSGYEHYKGISGRIAQLGGAAASAGEGTLDVSYELVVDKTNN